MMRPVGGPVLVELAAADGTPLQGLLYAPAEPDTAQAVLLHVHGKGGNFYTGPSRTLPPLVAPDRFVHLALNLRCHDLGYSRPADAAGIASGPGAVDGGMWERLDDGAVDIDAGVRWLRERTGLPTIVVGHSAGGYFLGDYSAQRPDLAGRVFLSPLTSVRFPLSTWWSDEDELRAVGVRAEKMVAAGQGHLLIPVTSWYYAISAASLVERLNERPGRWLDGCNASTSPLLLVWGGRETRVAEWRSVYEQLTVARKRSVELPGVGHNYDGQHDALSTALIEFVDSVIADADQPPGRP